MLGFCVRGQHTVTPDPLGPTFSTRGSQPRFQWVPDLGVCHSFPLSLTGGVKEGGIFRIMKLNSLWNIIYNDIFYIMQCRNLHIYFIEDLSNNLFKHF